MAIRVGSHSRLQAEVAERHAAARAAMAAAGFSALLVYGDNKLYGNLRYLSGVFPDRAGWISLTHSTVFVFEGALVLLPLEGEPTLLHVVERRDHGERLLVGADGLVPLSQAQPALRLAPPSVPR